MVELNRKQKREILIENYVRALFLLGEDATCQYGNIQYKYVGKDLIIVNIDVKDKNIVIDPIYDVWDVKNNKKIDKIESIDLGSIRKINGTFRGGNLRYFKAKNVRSLPDYCFNCCTKLELIDTPNVQNIGEECFFNCKSLKIIKMPRLVHLGRSAINNTGIKELVLGDVSFNYFSEPIQNNNKLKRVVFKSVKNIPYDIYIKSIEYLDIGYFYESVYYFDFDYKDNLMDNYKLSADDLEYNKKIFNFLLEHNLFVKPPLKYYTSYEAVCRNDILLDFMTCNSLKEFHFKLPNDYINLGLSEYYINLFMSYLPEQCKVILDK